MALNPNEALKKLRNLQQQIQKRNSLESSNQSYDNEAIEMATWFEDLDEFLRRGGMVPSDWIKADTVPNGKDTPSFTGVLRGQL